MAKNKSPKLPDAPQFTDTTSGIGNSLISGDIPGWLQSTISPDFSAQAISAAQHNLQPQYDQNNLDTKNYLADIGALNSSTATDAFAKNAYNLNSTLQGFGLNQAIQDAYSANQNKLGLFGTGLSTLQNNQNSKNQFNLENYSNQVAQVLAGQKQPNPLFGGLGTALGAGAGFILSGGNPLGAGLGATIGGGLGGTIDSQRGANGSVGFSGMGGGLSMMGNPGMNSRFIPFSQGNIPGSGFMGSTLAGNTQSQLLGFDTSAYRNLLTH